MIMSMSGGYRRLLVGLLLVAVSIGTGGTLGAQASGDNVGAALPDSAVSASAATQFQCPLAPCTLNNVQASGLGSSAAFSSSIVVNPKNSKQILSGAVDINCTTTPRSFSAFYSSSDGGATWSHVCLGTLSGFIGQGNPIVGYDLKNTSYIGDVDVNSQGASDIVLEKSTNNGATWSAPAIALTPFFTSGQISRPWLEVDTTKGSPHVNTLYLSATQIAYNGDSLIAVSHSSDGGATWSVSKAVDNVQLEGLKEHDEFSDIAIGRDGTVYVSWMRCTANNPAGGCGGQPATMEVVKSTDGGTTWSAPVTIASVTLAPLPTSGGGGGYWGGLPNTHEETTNIPAIGIDDSTSTFAGRLYVVMYNWTGTSMQVEVASSSNGGATWGVPVPVAPSVTHDQFFPWLSVSPTGVVGVTWLDRRNDPANVNYEAFATFSTNGGSSFAPNVRIANAVSNPNNGGGGFFMGDRTGNTWVGNALYAAWMDTRNGTTAQDEVGGVLIQ